MSQSGQLSPILAGLKAHTSALKLSLVRIRHHKFAHLLTLLVTTVAFLLPMLLYLTLNNLQHLAQHYGNGTQLQVYLNPEIDTASRDELIEKIKTQQSGYHVDIILPEQALKEFVAQTQSADLVADLSENPLEPLLLLTPRTLSVHPEPLIEMKKWLESQNHVVEVSLDNLWIKRLQATIVLLSEFFWGLVAILGFAVVIIMANFAQSTSEQYQEQINLLSTIGASPAYIRRPFLYTGVLLGLAASLLALLGAKLAMTLINPAAQVLLGLYHVQCHMSTPKWQTSAIALLSCAIIGYIGPFAAISLKVRQQG